MCLTGKRLTVGLATIHTSLQSVPSLLETEELVRIGTLLKTSASARESCARVSPWQP